MQQEFFEHEFLKPKTIQKREYQLSLMQSVLHKGNTLIVAPTALGKTIVAILVAAEMLKNKNKKIIFLAPTKPLALQHFQSLKKFLNLDSKEFALLTGAVSPKKRTELWENCRIVSATPQTIETDLLAGRISLRNVKLAVFDEAHRAVGNFSYVFLAQMLMKQSKDVLILGLTASPGAEEERIVDVCRNLFIENIEVKTLNDEDVKPYVYGIDVHWIKIGLPFEFARVKALLEKFIEEKIEILNKFNFVKIPKAYSMKCLLDMQKKVIEQIKRKNNAAFHAASLVAAMLKIVHALTMLETQGISALKKYFEKLQNEKSKAAKMLLNDKRILEAIRLVNEYSSRKIEHPKWIKLKDILLRELRENSAKKIIVFNHYRDSIKPLAEYLSNFSIKVKRFVGQSSKLNDKGLTQKKQAQIIEEFKEGKFNVLLCSSVGEEGLDLPNVDLVIFYEPVPSCIRTIQRMGRTGRFQKGKVLVLITKNTRDEAFYWSAITKQRKMNSLLKNLMSSKKILPKQTTLYSFSDAKNKLIIFADNRESNDVIKFLHKPDVLLQLRNLPIGDFAIGETIIERKTVSDFISSIVDGRLFNQLLAMKTNHGSALLIIEGNPSELFNKNIHKNAILGALTTVALTYKIPMVFTSGAEETANLLYIIAKREQQHKDKEIKLRFGKKGLTLAERQRFIVESFPNVGPTLAKSLLKQFKSIKNIVNATIADLMQIPNLGKKKAEQIKKVLEAKYEEENEN